MEQKTRDEGRCNATSCLILTLAYQTSPMHFPTMLRNCNFYTRTGFCNFNSSIASLDGCASAYACGKNHIFRDVPSVLIFVLFIHAVLYLSFPLNEFSVLLLSMFACHVFLKKIHCILWNEAVMEASLYISFILQLSHFWLWFYDCFFKWL